MVLFFRKKVLPTQETLLTYCLFKMLKKIGSMCISVWRGNRVVKTWNSISYILLMMQFHLYCSGIRVKHFVFYYYVLYFLPSLLWSSKFKVCSITLITNQFTFTSQLLKTTQCLPIISDTDSIFLCTHSLQYIQKLQ